MQQSLTIGISEDDLNRARSVLGLPIREPYNAYIGTSSYRVAERENGEGAPGSARRGSRSSVKHGSSEQDLGYNSQPGSRRESMNVRKIDEDCHKICKTISILVLTCISCRL